MRVPWGSFDSLRRVQEEKKKKEDKNKGYAMGKSRVMSEEELCAILERAMGAAREPLAQLDMDSLDLDIELMSIPAVPPAAPPTPAGCKHLPASGTHPISIRVPAWVLRSFKEQAIKSGVSYQTLMNRWLKMGVASFV